MECDAEDVLVAAQELEIGLYRLTMVTPLACTNESLREVEKRLETLGVRAMCFLCNFLLFHDVRS